MKRPENSREFADWNEEMVRRYDPDAYHTSSSLPIRMVERMRVRQVARLLALTPEARVLEIGCGGGNVLERIGGRRFGIDLSPSMLQKAQSRLKGKAQFSRADAMHLPFCDAAFDRVFCSEVLEHVMDPEAVVREMRRVLKPNGFAVVSVPNEDLINRVKQVVFALPFGRRLIGGGEDGYTVADKMDDEWHLHAFSLDRLLLSAGSVFRVDRVVGVPSRLMPLRFVARFTPR